MADVGLIERQVDTSNVLASTELLPFEYEAKPAYDVVKRLFDIVSSLAALVVLSPFLVIVAIVIMVDDNKGSPIFSQIRCGKNGKYFKIYKFRTMCCDAESKLEALQKKNEMDGPVFKIKDDPRVTRVGKFLRSSGIDELPQLINIIKGDMSVVGPRPALPKEVKQYNDEQRIIANQTNIRTSSVSR